MSSAVSFRMLSGNGNADLPSPPAMLPNWKTALSVVDTLISDFSSGTGNGIVNGFVAGRGEVTFFVPNRE